MGDAAETPQVVGSVGRVQLSLPRLNPKRRFLLRLLKPMSV
jgi:hypothetical protein